MDSVLPEPPLLVGRGDKGGSVDDTVIFSFAIACFASFAASFSANFSSSGDNPLSLAFLLLFFPLASFLSSLFRLPLPRRFRDEESESDDGDGDRLAASGNSAVSAQARSARTVVFLAT